MLYFLFLLFYKSRLSWLSVERKRPSNQGFSDFRPTTRPTTGSTTKRQPALIFYFSHSGGSSFFFFYKSRLSWLSVERKRPSNQGFSDFRPTTRPTTGSTTTRQPALIYYFSHSGGSSSCSTSSGVNSSFARQPDRQPARQQHGNRH